MEESGDVPYLEFGYNSENIELDILEYIEWEVTTGHNCPEMPEIKINTDETAESSFCEYYINPEITEISSDGGSILSIDTSNANSIRKEIDIYVCQNDYSFTNKEIYQF